MTSTMRPLRVGFELCTVETGYGGVNPTWHDLLGMAQRAEECGFDSLWIPGHLNHFLDQS